MNSSTFIARILGPMFVVIGIGLLLEGEAFRAVAADFLHSQGLIYLSGLITISVGLAILNVHHLWVRDWRVIITIFGWLSLIGGIFRILATSLVQKVGDSIIAYAHWPILGAVGVLVLGAFLTVMGYQDVWDEGGQRPARRTAPAKSASSTSGSTKRPRRKPKPPQQSGGAD